MGACCDARQPGTARRTGGLRFLDVEPFFWVVPLEATFFRVDCVGVPLGRDVAGPIAIIAAISTDTYERKIRVYQNHTPRSALASPFLRISMFNRLIFWLSVDSGMRSDSAASVWLQLVDSSTSTILRRS